MFWTEDEAVDRETKETIVWIGDEAIDKGMLHEITETYAYFFLKDMLVKI